MLYLLSSQEYFCKYSTYNQAASGRYIIISIESANLFNSIFLVLYRLEIDTPFVSNKSHSILGKREKRDTA